MQAAGVDAGAVLNAQDVSVDPHFRSRGFLREVETPDAGAVYWNRPGYSLSGPGRSFCRRPGSPSTMTKSSAKCWE